MNRQNNRTSTNRNVFDNSNDAFNTDSSSANQNTNFRDDGSGMMMMNNRNPYNQHHTINQQKHKGVSVTTTYKTFDKRPSSLNSGNKRRGGRGRTRQSGSSNTSRSRSRRGRSNNRNNDNMIYSSSSGQTVDGQSNLSTAARRVKNRNSVSNRSTTRRTNTTRRSSRRRTRTGGNRTRGRRSTNSSSRSSTRRTRGGRRKTNSRRNNSSSRRRTNGRRNTSRR